MQFIYHPGKRWEKEKGQYKEKESGAGNNLQPEEN